MNSIRVITISREYGSGGAAIGQELATRLGWKLLDRELILEMARRAHVQPSQVSKIDEHYTSFIARLLKSFWRGNELTWSGPPPEIVDADYLAQLGAIVIEEAAKIGGCVIIGRGSQCILRDRRNVFHVFVYGTRGKKLERLRVRHSSEGECERALVEVDRTRAAFIRRYYDNDWDDRRLYDLMINSDIGIDRASDAILSAAGFVTEKQSLRTEATQPVVG